MSMHARTGTSRRLTGARRHTLLTFHIGGGVALLGTAAGLIVTGAYAAGQNPAEAHTIYSLTRVLVFSLDVPFAAIALVSGVWLSVASKWGLFGYWWVVGSLVLLVATIIVGAAVIGLSLKSALDATGQGNSPGASQWLLIVAPTLQIPMLLGATIFGVFKPFGPISRSARAPVVSQ
jgi:hypothetical protein